MKSLFLIFNGRFPSEKAASIFAAKSCEYFAEAGNKVTLLVPRRIGRGTDNPYEHYHVRKNFRIVYLPTLDLFKLRFFQKIAFQIGFVVFSISCFFYLLFKAKKDDVIYSNESLPLLFASLYFKVTLYEVHDFPENKLWYYEMLFRRIRQILITNTWKVEQAQRLFGIHRSKIICERNAVEVKYFDIPLTHEEARKKLGLSSTGNIVVYTGHLYGWKGVDTLAEAAKMLPADTLVVFIGGTKNDTERFREKYGAAKNIMITGNRDHSEMPIWQKAADVLVLPNTAKEDISKYYTSPMKLFEYMASRRPIVASNIPSIAELLNKKNAVLVEPDSPCDFARGIELVLGDKAYARAIADEAFENVLQHTWERRAERIIKFINKDDKIG